METSYRLWISVAASLLRSILEYLVLRRILKFEYGVTIHPNQHTQFSAASTYSGKKSSSSSDSAREKKIVSRQKLSFFPINDLNCKFFLHLVIK